MTTTMAIQSTPAIDVATTTFNRRSLSLIVPAKQWTTSNRRPAISSRLATDDLQERFKFQTKRKLNNDLQSTRCSTYCFLGVLVPPTTALSTSGATISGEPSQVREVCKVLTVNTTATSHAASELMQGLVLVDLEPATAKLVIGILGPFLSVFGFLFILRIIMSWYPRLPVGKFPYIVAYAPTEPLLIPTRKLIPPLGGVDVTPVVWFGLISFLNEILAGPQGLLVLLSQQI